MRHMTAIDFGITDSAATPKKEEAAESFPAPSDNEVIVKTDGENIDLYSRHSLENTDTANNLKPFRRIVTTRGINHYRTRLTEANAFTLRYGLTRLGKPILDEDTKQALKGKANTAPMPYATLDASGTKVIVTIPPVPHYLDMIVGTINATFKDGKRVFPISRLLNLQALQDNYDGPLPPIALSDEVEQINSAPIPGYDGTVESLRTIPITVLNIVQADIQSGKERGKSRKTFAEKMTKLGIETLHDLLFWVPLRHISRRHDQDLTGIVEGETVTILGRIQSITPLNGKVPGTRFTITTDTGQELKATYFNQAWLARKFKVGDEVVASGKWKPWKGTPQINGSTMDASKEAEMMPIVPVYRQLPSIGLTSRLILSAVREMLSRLPRIDPPKYLQGIQVDGNSTSYHDAVTAMHFCEDEDQYDEATGLLALIEVIYMQLLILSSQETNASKRAVTITSGRGGLQADAIKALPFNLTNGQKKALVRMNRKMESTTPSSTLLSADVGAGKTVVAQMTAMRAVGAGKQAVMLAPTDVLARQLYESTLNVTSRLKEKTGQDIEVTLFSGSMKAAQKREAKKTIADGTSQIIIGTHALLSNDVEYHDLGFIAVDEQQKFGVEQRERLLNSRTDGLIPHLMTMTATPIPRSTAQVFYGGMDLIELKDKPPGRLPIITQWIQDNPITFSEHSINPVWADIINEAHKGNQTFVITPLVSESSKVDAASVDATTKNLTSLPLSGLKVGKVHGQMKPDEQRNIMQQFRDKKFDVLVASTVVEVGVDIPDATRVVILSAERLGAASLHQIRGRVGRNSKQSRCYLISEGTTSSAQARMNALVDSNDGFKIAQSDLGQRGEGRIFGTQQSGNTGMLFASVLGSMDKISQAQKVARDILASDSREQALADAHAYFHTDEGK